MLPFGFPDNPILFKGHEFGLGFAIVNEPNKTPGINFPKEIHWGGGLNTDFWINPNNKVIILSMCQFQPRNTMVAHTVKKFAYRYII